MDIDGTAPGDAQFQEDFPGGARFQSSARFQVTMRGYDRRQVQRYLDDAASSTGPLPAGEFDIVVRGYRCSEVDAHVDRLRESRNGEPAGGARPQDFGVRFRGYDRRQVDIYVQSAALGAIDPQPVFDVVLRGYDRAEVDRFVRRMRRRARLADQGDQTFPGPQEDQDG